MRAIGLILAGGSSARMKELTKIVRQQHCRLPVDTAASILYLAACPVPGLTKLVSLRSTIQSR